MRLELLLRGVPGKVQLLARCREVNHRARLAQLLARLRGGGAGVEPARYRPGPPLARLRAELERAHRTFEDRGVAESPTLVPHYLGRIQELALEAQLADSVGAPGFAQLAAVRFPTHSLSLDALSEALRPRGPEGKKPPGKHVALSAVLGRWVAALGWPLRVEPAPNLASNAAFGGGVLWVRSNARLPERDAERIAAHELLGHALPALNAATQPVALLRLGSAAGLDCQEGRALLLEQQHGLLGFERWVELRARHAAALTLRGGAGLVESARAAKEQGCSEEAACTIALRVARGGGLCRELAYLQHAHWVRGALLQEPQLDAIGELGSVDLAATRSLAAVGLCRAPDFGTRRQASRRLGLAY